MVSVAFKDGYPHDVYEVLKPKFRKVLERHVDELVQLMYHCTVCHGNYTVSLRLAVLPRIDDGVVTLAQTSKGFLVYG